MSGWPLVIVIVSTLAAVWAGGWLLRTRGMNSRWQLLYWLAIALGLFVLINLFR